MSALTAARLVPRTLLAASLQAGKVPVSIAGRLTGHGGNECWGPTLAYESLEARVEGALGSVLRDQALTQKARLRRVKLTELRRAAELEARADSVRDRAEQNAQEAQTQADEERAEAARKAEQRERELQRQAKAREQKIEKKAAQKKAAARQLKVAADEEADRRELTGTAVALDVESRALHATKRALDAEQAVRDVDETIEASKAARKSG
jgi:flagellar biosynthesis GTPase FlhF